MKLSRLPIVWLLLAGAALPLVGCEEGAFEEAGEEIDDAADDVGDEIDRRN
jgi:tRNA A37 threonylcarbamoyltransferase TsaD